MASLHVAFVQDILILYCLYIRLYKTAIGNGTYIGSTHEEKAMPPVEKQPFMYDLVPVLKLQRD